MADYLTYANLKDIVERAIKKTSGSMEDIIEDTLNSVYLEEVVNADPLYPLFWLVDFDDSLSAVDSSSISAITKAAPGVFTTSAAHGLSVNDIVVLYDVLGMTEVNRITFLVNTVPSTTTFTLKSMSGTALDTSSYTTYESGGTVLHRGVTLATSGKDVEQILEVGWNGYSDGLASITKRELVQDSTFTSNSATIPRRYLHMKEYSAAGVETNRLLWYPGSGQSLSLVYWFLKRLSPLSNDSDVPLLPPRFHRLLATGTIMRLMESKVQVENQVLWPTLYSTQLANLVQYNRNYYEKENKEWKSLKFS